MVQTKKMNESSFVKMQKDLTVTGEWVRSRQDEKQALLNEFDSECKRFFFGKISQRALMASIKKTNSELYKLDGSIRDAIKKAKNISSGEMKLVGNQVPIGYRATISGITGGSKKSKKKAVKKKAVVKKAVKKKAVKKKAKKKVAKKTVKRKKKK